MPKYRPSLDEFDEVLDLVPDIFRKNNINDTNDNHITQDRACLKSVIVPKPAVYRTFSDYKLPPEVDKSDRTKTDRTDADVLENKRRNHFVYTLPND